ncbi:Ribonuclease h domain, partial [Thalictrum thalictroides]
MVAGAELSWFQDTWNVTVNTQQQKQITCQCEKAEAGACTLNTDGSLQGDQAGWAAVIRDDEGNVVAAAHGRSKYYSIALIELNALDQGLTLALRHDIRRIRAQTDSSNVVSFFKSGYVVPWQANNMMKRIRKM